MAFPKPDESEYGRETLVPTTEAVPQSCSLLDSTKPESEKVESEKVAPADGRYELTDCTLGEGAFAFVHRVKDKNLNTYVAMKVLKQEHLDGKSADDAVSLFRREALILAKIRHPNVLYVIDCEQTNAGVPYIIAEYLDGQILSDLLADGQPLPFSRVSLLLKQLCSAVQAIHLADVIHRDLKPENLMLVDRNGSEHLVVLDFGVARQLGDDRHPLTVNAPLGTPQYMSPEQFSLSVDATRQSDLYAIGVILFKMMTGQLPFEGRFTELRDLHRDAQPPNPRDLNSRIPKNTAAVILKAMEKDPQRRYQSADDLWQDFEESL